MLYVFHAPDLSSPSSYFLPLHTAFFSLIDSILPLNEDARHMEFSTFFHQEISPLIVKTILTYLFYGIYFVLFCVCMFFHYRHATSARKPYQRLALIAIFFLATVTIILDTTATMKQIWLSLGQNWGGLGDSEIVDQTTAQLAAQLAAQLDLICGSIVFLLYVLTNFIADLVLIHRTSVIWKGRRLMIWIPLCVSILNNALAIIGVGFDASYVSKYPSLSVPFSEYTNGDKIVLAYLIMNACLNFALTGCLAGRIWWLGRRTGSILQDDSLRRKYNSTVALTLESGILYPIALIISVVITVLRPNSPNLYPFLVQVVGTAPTLIVVRTVLGLSVENTDSEEGNNSTTLNTYTNSTGSQSARFDEKIKVQAPSTHRSVSGSRFTVPLYSASSAQSQTETFQSSSVASSHPQVELEAYAVNSRLPRAGEKHYGHARQSSGVPNDAIPTSALSHSHSKPSRAARSLPVPRRMRTRFAKTTIDEETSRSQTPPLNIVVHTSVEQVSE